MCYGPEYVSGKLLTWAQKRGINIQYIQPGKPQPNAYVERYNRMALGGITPAQKLKRAA